MSMLCYGLFSKIRCEIINREYAQCISFSFYSMVLFNSNAGGAHMKSFEK